MSKISVCIVEDQQHIRESLQILVESDEELSCIGVFENGKIAVNEIPKLNPDIVMMDIEMPILDGIEAIRQLRVLCPKTQFMVCTIYDEDAKVFDALKAGAMAYLLKRSSPQEIRSAIKDLYQGGSPISSDIARKVIMSFQQKPQLPENQHNLTNREIEILGLLSKGFSYEEVAESLFISIKTVKKHIFNIYEKLQVHSKIEAINKYFGR
jgi:DNA-binding NarL/FixJ family response regulator